MKTSWILLVLTGSLGGCVSSKAETTPAPSAVSPGAAPVSGTAPASVGEPAPREAPAPSAPSPVGPLVHGLQGAPSSQALAPPPTAGAARVEVTGCAAAANETDTQRFVATTRGLSPPPTVEAVPGGALVVHPLDHACCLKLAVATRVEGSTAIVRETLSGSPCRCRCGSTVRTTLGLKAGRWKVAIEVDDSKGLRRVHEQELEAR